jgi:hypothetical protein
MVQPAWIATTVVILTGLGMILFGHFLAGYSELIIFGVIVLSLGITLSAVAGGVHRPVVLIVLFFLLLVVFTAVDVYNIGGLQGWI